MDAETTGPRSHLFTVRVWQENLGGGQFEWRGRVQDVLSGEVFYFRDWLELVAYLKTWLQEGGTAVDV